MQSNGPLKTSLNPKGMDIPRGPPKNPLGGRSKVWIKNMIFGLRLAIIRIKITNFGPNVVPIIQIEALGRLDEVIPVGDTNRVVSHFLSYLICDIDK